MEKDYGVRFTDLVYLSKDEIKKELNITSIDSIWNKVITYRSLYTKQLNLSSYDSIPFSVVLSPSILYKLFLTEKKFLKKYMNLLKLTYSSFDDVATFRMSQKREIARVIASNYDIRISDQLLNALVLNKIDTVPVEQIIITRYIGTLNKLISCHDEVNLDLLLKIYTSLRGIEIKEDPIFYLRRDESDIFNDISSNTYEGIKSSFILEKINELLNFLNHEDIPSIGKAILAYFTILYIRPFDYYNEEVAFLLCKYIISSNDYEELPYLLNLEEAFFLNKKRIYDSFKETVSSYDSTYTLTYILDLILSQIDKLILPESNEYLLHAHAEIEEVNINQSFKSTPVNTPENREINGVNFEQKIAMPDLPVGLDDSDASLIAHHLLEVYPSLKRSQANFYAHHCTIGKYYTISQYKKEENVAYETARTSMDNLAVLGFYRKEQIKNKFVYTPVNRK